MALTGIQIFKLLPKTNCGECGVPTCLAFAMNLAAGKAELDTCPYVSDEARAQLAEASAPPIRPVAIGSGKTACKTGGETVLFRHEKTFYNPCPLAGTLSDDDPDLVDKVKTWDGFEWERVGLYLRPELILSVRSIGAGRRALYRFVYLPAAIPAVLTALRVSVGTAIAVLFIAESFATTSGLGYYIITETWGVLRYTEMYSGVLAMSLLGLALYLAIDVLDRRLCPWRQAR